ncbi:MAG: queuosine salvage family protein [Chloroflexi bacterium]|nr:queuosine salvage family protein [Chloroflexota bacterium]
MRLLEEVRATAAAVATSARYVRVQASAIEAYAATLPVQMAQSPELDPATHYTGASDATLAFVVTLDAINFGSGYFPKLTKRPGLSGYFTVAASLKECYEARGPLTADRLATLRASECARIFGQVDNAEPAIAELMALFSRALNDLGRYIADRFGGSFRALVDASAGSAERLVEVLVEMPLYQDVGFYKRAQLTASDLAVAHVAQFGDLDRLTIFADNLVPHVLRVDGILHPLGCARGIRLWARAGAACLDKRKRTLVVHLRGKSRS